MERALARSGARLRSSRLADNQRPLEDAASRSSSSSSEDRGRDILLRLLKQITEFLERKEMMSTRVAASKEWRKSRSRRHSEASSNNLFEVVIQVCEQRMRRLNRSTSFGGREEEEWSAQSPRMLVAEAIVQELLVSLMELRMKEKETLVMDEVESVEIMRQLHVHLQKDEEMVRTKVCVGAGDEQQLEELQLMLRTDFLEEAAGADSPQKQQQADSMANNEASLQFAWETIEDQKKEIIRLRAENEELKRSSSNSESAPAMRASMFDDEPTKVINLLRSQLSSHHDKNLNILQDHIQRLEKALHSATAASRKTRRGWDGSKSTFDSSHSSEKEDWSSLLSRSVVGTDFSRTQVPRRKCEECRKNAASLLTLRSEVKQLRAHAATDEESLLQAEKDRGHLQRENSALSTALLSAKQRQEELRQMILDLTREKHQLQNLGDSEQRTSERTIRVLQDQLSAVEEQKTHQKRKFDELTSKYDAEVSAKRTLAKQYADLQDLHTKLSQSTAELEKQVVNLGEAAQRCEEQVEERGSALRSLQAQLDSMEEDGESRAAELREKEALADELGAKLSSVQLCLDNLEVEKRRATGEIERLLQTLDECKRKNQRLEKGFEELKQGKELLASLQQVERGASALQLSDLEQAREQLGSLKLQLSSTKSECNRLEQALSEANKASNSSRKQCTHEVERVQHELETMKQRCLTLEKQVSAQHAMQSNLEATKNENCERIDNLTQELAESKTAMLVWMSKYNALGEERQKLEDDMQGLSEEQYSLQRMVDELQAEREASTQAQQAQADSERELREELSSLNEQHRTMERERRVVDQEKKALVKLVQTLQARPELQQRAFREMLMTCQRGTERMLRGLSESIAVTLKKLSAVEENYQTLKTRLASRQQAQKLALEQAVSSGGKDRRSLKPASPQIVVQEEDFMSSSNSPFDDLSASHPMWLEKIVPLDTVDLHSHDERRERPSQARGADELTGYLVEINTKVASWRVAVDRKITEYAERSSQLKSLRTRCSELKDLVGLNQRLIEEMERRAAGQQSVVEAAWDFATAYKALSPSARAQVFQSRDFLSASKGIVEGLNSLGLTRSVNKLSQTLGASYRNQAESTTLKRVNFLSASAAPGISAEATEKPQKKLNDSNIELLEDAVGSLKAAVQKQRSLQRELKEKERSLTVTTKELEKRNLQFLMLRSFLQWKCASSNRDCRSK
uniref:Uncharacterized protein n=1 Tax=Phytophthora ramorum TaxID=164328 RepID=H3GNT9_PHYRM